MNTAPVFLRRLAAALVAAPLLLPAAAAGQDLPEASAVIARYQQAIGGRDVLRGFDSMHAVGEFSMPAQGLVASIEMWSARPNKAAMRVEIAGFGEMRTGHTGEVAWSLNPMEGPRLLQGSEAVQTIEEAAFESGLRTDDVIASATTVERTTLAGRPCLKVRLEWKSGRESHDCYSEETGLLVGSLARQETNLGAIDAVTLFDEYREFNGFRTPTRITIQMVGVEQVITLREITFNDVPESAFEAPPEVRALIR